MLKLILDTEHTDRENDLFSANPSFISSDIKFKLKTYEKTMMDKLKDEFFLNLQQILFNNCGSDALTMSVSVRCENFQFTAMDSDDERPIEEIIQHSSDNVCIVKKSPAARGAKEPKKTAYHPVLKPYKRKVRCKKCAGCLADCCGTCRNCR